MKEISGETNVSSYRFGSGSIEEIGKFVVVTMDILWDITRELLGGKPEQVLFMNSVDQVILDQKLLSLRECDTIIIGIGGGIAVDAAKYFS